MPGDGFIGFVVLFYINLLCFGVLYTFLEEEILKNSIFWLLSKKSSFFMKTLKVEISKLMMLKMVRKWSQIDSRSSWKKLRALARGENVLEMKATPKTGF